MTIVRTLAWDVWRELREAGRREQAGGRTTAC